MIPERIGRYDLVRYTERWLDGPADPYARHFAPVGFHGAHVTLEVRDSADGKRYFVHNLLTVEDIRQGKFDVIDHIRQRMVHMLLVESEGLSG